MDTTTLIVVGSIGFSILIIDGILLAIIIIVRKGVAKAAGWSSTQGTVMMSTIQYRRTGKSNSPYPIVMYTYQVMGRAYQGNSITPGVEVGGSGAHKVVERYPMGAQVTVYYDPNNPADAILERGMPGYIRWLWITIFLVTVFLSALGVVLAFTI